MSTGYMILIVLTLIVALGIGAMNLATLFIGNECMDSCADYTASKPTNKDFLQWMLYSTIAFVIILCISSSCASALWSASDTPGQ